MKRGFLVLMVLIVIGFMGCDNDTTSGVGEPTKFEGTWKNPAGSQNTYTFTGNNWSRTNNSDQNANGTFTFTDTTITFVPTSGNSWSQGYTLSATQLSLDNVGGVPYGDFSKQP
jgi:hypothetical protein